MKHGEPSNVDLGENSSLVFNNYDIMIKDEFDSDDDSFEDLHLDLSIDSDLGDVCGVQPEKKDEEVKKNKRKSLVPQRATLQSDNSQTESGENNSESSQDAVPSPTTTVDPADQFASGKIAECDAFDDDNGLVDIAEESIFKDLEEEAEAEGLDKKFIQNVREDWQAHWGIKCNMCNKVFTFKSTFEEHYRETYKTVPVYTCSFCDRILENYSSFRSHCYRHVTENRYKCKECPKGFILRSLLHVHMLAKHARSKPFTCEECGKSFVTKPGLKIHLKKHTSEIKEDYPCVECGKVLHTRGGLTSHMNVHRLGRRFMCDVCGKTFTQKVNMQQHVKQHTGDKPYECDKCGKTFAEKSHLSRHYSFHSEQRPYKCDICQKMYKTERCLKVHSMVHAKERPYICSYCAKGFLSSTKLKQHYNIHTGERPYACKYCERKFTNYPNWLKHTRRRHNVDHRTGANLPPKTTKSKHGPTEIAPPFTSEDLPPVPPKSEPSPPAELRLAPDTQMLADLLPLVESNDPLAHDNFITDFKLSKTDELLLQQGLINFPVTDDKLFLQQHVDIFPSTTGNNVLAPYFQNQLPNTATIISNGQSTSQLQLNEYFPVQFIQ